jgi:hypothetical protein
LEAGSEGRGIYRAVKIRESMYTKYFPEAKARKIIFKCYPVVGLISYH